MEKKEYVEEEVEGPFPIALTELRRDHCSLPAHSAALIRSIPRPGTAPGLQVGWTAERIRGPRAASEAAGGRPFKSTLKKHWLYVLVCVCARACVRVSACVSVSASRCICFCVCVCL